MRTFIAATFFATLIASLCSPLAAQTAPNFLFLVEGKGVPTGTIHVFNINSSTGGITEVSGSPFNAGLIPDQLVADPTGRFVYVTNDQSQDITGFSVDASSGALTELPGSPFPIGAQPVTAAVDPTGRFFYVFAVSFVNSGQEEFLYEYTIDSATGVLTPASSSPTAWESQQGTSIVSMAFNPAGDHAYLGQVISGNSGAPILICSVDFITGALAQIGSVRPAAAGEASHMAISPSGRFLYSVDSPSNDADAFTIDSISGQLTEISGSPYTALPNYPDSLAVHPSGNFLYIANQNQSYQTNYAPSQYDGSVSAFAIDSKSGALTAVPGSPFAAGINPFSIVVDPAGRFAYSSSTIYTSGYTGFAQIVGFTIDPSSGTLTPLPGTPWTDLATSIGEQLTVSHGPLTTTDPVPMISSLSPPSTIANATAFTLQVNGAGFVPGSTVYFGERPRSTTFVSSTQLNASILASDIDNDGTAVVFVFNPLPGGGASTSVEFPVSIPAPIISSINPSSVAAGGNPIALFAIGANFVTSSVLNFNGAPRVTTYLTPTLLFASISRADIVAQGTASISVTTPSNGVPGGGTSNTVTLTISPPNAPLAVSTISPTSATAGGPAFPLTVNGSGFVQGSQVTFNLNNVPTTFVNSTQLTAGIPASAIAIAGNPYVIVTNPDRSTSMQVTFVVNNPQPGGGSVSPPSLPAGSNALTLNVIGIDFVPGSVVLVNGSSRVTSYVSSTMLQATLLPTDLAQGGTLNITVTNPPPGGGTTALISFTVADYMVTPPNSTLPISAGQTAKFALTVSPSNGTYSDPVTFSLSPLPAGASASFAPSATITPGATPQIVMLSIATMPHTAESTINFPQASQPILPLLCLVGVLFGLMRLSLRASGSRGRRLSPQLLLILLMMATAGLIGCGAVGVGPSSPPQLNPATGTPSGTYPIIVTATSGGVSHSTTVTLTVM